MYNILNNTSITLLIAWLGAVTKVTTVAVGMTILLPNLTASSRIRPISKLSLMEFMSIPVVGISTMQSQVVKQKPRRKRRSQILIQQPPPPLTTTMIKTTRMAKTTKTTKMTKMTRSMIQMMRMIPQIPAPPQTPAPIKRVIIHLLDA